MLIKKGGSENYTLIVGVMNKDAPVQPKIVGILPVYNVAPYLRECLDSLVNQTYPNLTIIAVNDGSTDNSGDILKEYQNKFSNIEVITQTNKGVSGARNAGLARINELNTTFDYVAFFDSDDYYDIHYLEEMVKPFSMCPGIAYTSCGWCNFDKNGSIPIKNFPIEQYSFASSTEDVINQYLRLGKWSNHPAGTFALPNKLFREELVRGTTFDTSLKKCEDQDWLLPMINKFKGCVVVNKLLYFRRRRKSSLSHVTKSWEYDLKVFCRIYELPEIQGTYLHHCMKSKLTEAVWNEMRYELNRKELSTQLQKTLNLVRKFSISSVTGKQKKRLAIIKLGNTALRFVLSRTAQRSADIAGFD